MSEQETFAGIPVLTFDSAEKWNSWLAVNHGDQLGVWIKIAKKHSGIQSITHLEALDEALCYGWIDGMRRGHDDTAFLQKFTPRRAKSSWSKVNIGKVETLIVAGRMKPQGQAEIDRAKADGRWDAAYESQANATIPDDFAAELEKSDAAKAFYESLTKAEKYAALWQLMTAKSPATRSTRLRTIVTKLALRQKP